MLLQEVTAIGPAPCPAVSSITASHSPGKRRLRPETRTPEPEKRISGCSHAPVGLSPRQSEALQARAQL